MYIAIPIDENKNITKMINAKEWAIIDFDEGVVKEISYAPSWQEHNKEWLDFVILENKFENTLDFLNEGIVTLTRREGQDSIDDIIEAFKFKELDEIGF